MKITETVERECCHPQKDLKLYQGVKIGDLKVVDRVWFCTHCGQFWRHHRAPGEMDAGLERVKILTTEP